MHYFLVAGILKLASSTQVTRSAYRMATRLRTVARPVWHEQAMWLLEDFPPGRCRVLDLGTGWVHGYSLYPALLRNDEIHCFDVSDLRHFGSFRRTVAVVAEQIDQLDVGREILQRAHERADAVQRASDFREAYDILGINYHVAPQGIPDYPEHSFDVVYSVDVLEHIQAGIFRAAAESWYRILKPEGRFLAQVGIDDHLSHYDHAKGTKHYMRYSQRMWDHLLQNDLQYINRLTATQILDALREAGLCLDDVATHDHGLSRSDAHSDYQWQTEWDMRASRLFVRAHKPG